MLGDPPGVRSARRLRPGRPGRPVGTGPGRAGRVGNLRGGTGARSHRARPGRSASANGGKPTAPPGGMGRPPVRGAARPGRPRTPPPIAPPSASRSTCEPRPGPSAPPAEAYAAPPRCCERTWPASPNPSAWPACGPAHGWDNEELAVILRDAFDPAASLDPGLPGSQLGPRRARWRSPRPGTGCATTRAGRRCSGSPNGPASPCPPTSCTRSSSPQGCAAAVCLHRPPSRHRRGVAPDPPGKDRSRRRQHPEGQDRPARRPLRQPRSTRTCWPGNAPSSPGTPT